MIVVGGQELSEMSESKLIEVYPPPCSVTKVIHVYTATDAIGSQASCFELRNGGKIVRNDEFFVVLPFITCSNLVFERNGRS